MNPGKLADAIERAVLSEVDSFTEDIQTIQSELYSKLLASLKDLELDSDGYILQNANNRKTLSKAEDVVHEYLPGKSLNESISNTLGAVPKIDALNNAYFSAISEGFKENRNFIKSLQSQTIESIEINLLSDGLTAQVKNPLIDILNRNVNSGGQFKGFLEEVKTFVEGNDQVDGRVLSYSRGYLRDALFQYSRTYQQAMTADLGLEFYLYAGGLIDTSRPFCQERAGNFYHQKEVEAWASLKWSGKMPGTTASSIFTLAGGYSCAHSIIPVSTLVVPPEVIQRAKDEGYIK